MAQKDTVFPLILRSVDSSGIAIDTWTAFHAAGTEEQCFLLQFISDSANDVFISFDGVNRHLFLPAGERMDYNFQTNASPPNYYAILKKGSVIYVQGIASQGDFIYMTGFYNQVGS